MKSKELLLKRLTLLLTFH